MVRLYSLAIIISISFLNSGVIAPPKQYAIFNKPFSLQCDSNHGADNRVWSRHGHNGTIDGSFNLTSLQDEGQYVCNLTVLGKTKTLTTELVVVGK